MQIGRLTVVSESEHPAVSEALFRIAGLLGNRLGTSTETASACAELARPDLDRAVNYLLKRLPGVQFSFVDLQSGKTSASACQADAEALPPLVVFWVSDLAQVLKNSDEVSTAQTSPTQALASRLGLTPPSIPGAHVAFSVSWRDEADCASALVRELPGDPDILFRELLVLLMNAIHASLGSGRALPVPSRVSPPNQLGTCLTRLMAAQHGNHWAALYYTGSVVSSLIHQVEQDCQSLGVPVLRGPSEHSLACAAMAGWQVHGRAFLIIVTSGMLDEFKGTLSNLRDAGAKGIIVCAESDHRTWRPFQGTCHAQEDMRSVLQARGLDFFYLENPETLTEDAGRALACHATSTKPVVVLATPPVLERLGSAEPRPAATPSMAHEPIPSRTAIETKYNSLLRILERDPIRVLCVAGELTSTERRLLGNLAKRLQIGICDTIIRPGQFTHYDQGTRCEEFLGTLGLYGYSHEVYRYLHTDGEINPPEKQLILFLNSSASQVETPFSANTLRRKLRIAQVCADPSALAPFSQITLECSAEEFLRYASERLAPSPEVVAQRATWLAAARAAYVEPCAELDTRPMYPNYFFRRLGELLTRLIELRGFRYHGVYDVGRCALSAMRNVPRTDLGFSGWFGRALMGDGLMAAPHLALLSEHAVIAFVGDGARAMVPDFVPWFTENVRTAAPSFRGNLTIFNLENGALSLIKSYRHLKFRAAGGRQMHVPRPSPRRTTAVAGITCHTQVLEDFDTEAIESALLRQRALNIFDVKLAHNDLGDGLNPLFELGWQHLGERT